MRRETTEERLQALKEQLHDISNTCNRIALRVDILWEERQLRRAKEPREEDRR